MQKKTAHLAQPTGMASRQKLR